MMSSSETLCSAVRRVLVPSEKCYAKKGRLLYERRVDMHVMRELITGRELGDDLDDYPLYKSGKLGPWLHPDIGKDGLDEGSDQENLEEEHRCPDPWPFSFLTL